MRFGPFTSDGLQVESFDCRNKDLSGFLCTDEIAKCSERIAKIVDS
jgi:hypothetical protein